MNLFIGALVLVALAGGAFFATRPDDKPASTKPAQSSTQQSTEANTSSQKTENSSTVTLTYTDSGFSPASLTIKSGTKLTVKNDSSRPLQFDSDPHPQHTDDPEINVGLVDPGQSQTITVTVTGSHGYHNHLSPGDTGTLIVE